MRWYVYDGSICGPFWFTWFRVLVPRGTVIIGWFTVVVVVVVLLLLLLLVGLFTRMRIGKKEKKKIVNLYKPPPPIPVVYYTFWNYGGGGLGRGMFFVEIRSSDGSSMKCLEFSIISPLRGSTVLTFWGTLFCSFRYTSPLPPPPLHPLRHGTVRYGTVWYGMVRYAVPSATPSIPLAS